MSEAEESKSNPQHERSKRARPRKKQLYDNILQQMEFYFSDASLSKDRFLGELIKNDPYVPVQIFLKFNKIHAMTQDAKDIIKALKSSSKLECSEDCSKVKRKIPLEPYNADERTVYVESIPVTVGIAWLKSVFEAYGSVAYISLPKFKNSQRIKGYAFVEFEKPEDAQSCLRVFTQMGCKLPTSMPPEDLSTIKTFSIDNTEENYTPNAKPVSPAPLNVPENTSVDPDEKVEEIIEKNDYDESTELQARAVETDGYEPPMKKLKHSPKDKKNRKRIEPSESSTESNDIKEPEVKMDKNELSNKEYESTAESEVQENPDDDKKKSESKKKTARKRKAKDRNRAKLNAAKNEAPEGAAWSLQVLSKNEWKSLRNKYLNLQRKHMKELKRTLRSKSTPLQMDTVKQTDPADPDTQMKPGSEQTKENLRINAKCPEKVPGVIVVVQLPEPCLDVRGLKKEVRSNMHVKHVEVKEGQTQMFVRFVSPETAQQYCKSGIYDSARVLSGTEEEAQWERIHEEWKARVAGGARRERGRQRLVQRALSTQPHSNKHIRFEEQ